MRQRVRGVLITAVVLALCAVGCGQRDRGKIGFVLVGQKDDVGYSQAVYEGSRAVARAFPNYEILVAEGVPEGEPAFAAMERLVSQGVKIVFSASYGFRDSAVRIARAHPDVVVLQQANEEGEPLPNFGTFFGTIYEAVYLAGVAAGKITKSNRLGFVYAFPIPDVFANVNAFQLGAASVNREVQTYVVNTSQWCGVSRQTDATTFLLAQGVDVTTQHQDCTATVVKTTESAGRFSVGYHVDTSSLAPTGWITGSQWDWGPLYVDMVRTIIDGKFPTSPYNNNFRAGFKTRTYPFKKSSFGPAVSAETRKLVEQAEARITQTSPFVGPVVDQVGRVRIPAGVVPDYATIETSMNYFVQGVVGKLIS